ncbi:3-hydroxyacyl-CoA dehydrogenase family protein [Pontibacter beigongshangensis]|uniref:3-hydroxyacyl-CoA dehydrogenase family protein n=1 Tax=Pontibacter beigongshangensis TaxID=2574733 RepID=UPI0016508981|nr:3-hydroxyacyl-CoA dehydrogenase family protein [Pontibacter beigongshangensis]
MQVLVLSTPEMAVEFKAKFPDPIAGHEPIFVESYERLAPLLERAEVVFDFLLADDREQLAVYAAHPGLVVFCHAVTVQLAELLQNQALRNTVIGFNGLPSLFNRPSLEVMLFRPADADVLKRTCERLKTPFLLTTDRVGMATPRVLCMIINEAYYTLQESIATIDAIDLAMRLGTNYPKGPFEWADQIGLANVYQILQALYADTKDERYKICPLLKTMVLHQAKTA